jgi:hypothetical protein
MELRNCASWAKLGLSGMLLLLHPWWHACFDLWPEKHNALSVALLSADVMS